MSDDRGKMVKPKAGQTMCGGYSTGSGGAQKLDTLIALLNRPYGNLTAGERKDAADEITALRARLEAVEKELVEMTAAKEIHQTRRAEYFARAERAEAALATARRDALEEAAKVCDCRDREKDDSMYLVGCIDASQANAKRIRALIDQTPADVTEQDARIPDHAAWAARGRWREAYEALRDLTDEAST